MKKQINYSLSLLGIALVLIMGSVCILCYAGCYDTQSQAHESTRNNDLYDNRDSVIYVPYFKEGQILYPDYACSDTLIIVDAVGLNKAMGAIEQCKGCDFWSDGDYDSLFHQYCRIK